MGHFQVIPAAYLLLQRGYGDETEFLLQLRGPGSSYMSGHWASGAAGHVEYGESVAVAAAREAREELGIEVSPDDIEPLCAVQRSEPGNPDPIEQRVDFFTTARRWTGQPRILEPGKCLELRWCRLDALPHPVVPHELHVLQCLAAADVPPVISLGF